MSLSIDQKKMVVSEVHEIAVSAYSALAAGYTGITVEQMTYLRAKARNDGVVLRVIKNSLAKRAFEETDFVCMNTGLTGPLIFAFSMDDPGGAARVLDNFAKENDRLVIKLVSIGGELYDASEVKRLASLPTRDQAIGMLMSVMKAPVGRLACTLNEVPGKLVRAVAAVRDQKKAA